MLELSLLNFQEMEGNCKLSRQTETLEGKLVL